MLRESDSFVVGDLVRPMFQYVKSLDRMHMITGRRQCVITVIGKEDEGGLSFLSFQGIEGEYLAHQFKKV